MIKYLFPFFLSFIITVFFIIAAVLIAKKINWKGRDSWRHIHKRNISRLGGTIMVLSFNIAIFSNRDLYLTPEIYGFALGAFVLLAAGFWDDLKEVFWKIQLFIQIAVAIFVFIMGIRIYCVTNPISGGIIKLDSGIGIIISVFLVIFWIIAVINSINWADGIDGLSGGITFLTVLTIFFLSFRPEVNQPPVAIICSALAGAILGFLIFNFYPSRIMAGTAGSMFMGYSLAVLAIIAGTKIATAVLVLAIPIIDFLWVIGERIKNKKSIFLPDKRHLHYKLMELGWSQRKIVFVYWLITAIIASVALNTRAIGKGITLGAVAIIMISALLIINRRLENENPSV